MLIIFFSCWIYCWFFFIIFISRFSAENNSIGSSIAFATNKRVGERKGEEFDSAYKKAFHLCRLERKMEVSDLKRKNFDSVLFHHDCIGYKQQVEGKGTISIKYYLFSFLIFGLPNAHCKT